MSEPSATADRALSVTAVALGVGLAFAAISVAPHRDPVRRETPRPAGVLRVLMVGPVDRRIPAPAGSFLDPRD